MKRVSLITAAVSALLFAGASHAVPFTLTSQLTGDARLSNPDNIFIDVTINGDTDSNSVSWLVDLNSPLHPNARLDTFTFNVLGLPLSFSFGGFSPNGWAIEGGTNTPGSGSADFRFEANDPPGNGNNVTNLTSLSFTMTRTVPLIGIPLNFSVLDFLFAPEACSNDSALGCGRLGAHVRGLGREGNQSGFAMGDYQYTPPPPPPTTNVPEPATLGLLALGLLGVGFARRKRSA